jgi:hypothetical protein
LLIAAALAIAVSAFWVSQRAPDFWTLPVTLCVLAGVGLVIFGNNKEQRTLYPLTLDGTPDMSQPGVVAPLAVALYVAGAGVVIALIGSAIIRLGMRAVDGATASAADRVTKKCPDCAETILSDANVCKHCGYRFAEAAKGSPAAEAERDRQRRSGLEPARRAPNASTK